MQQRYGTTATKHQTIPLCAVALATGVLLLVPTNLVLLSAAALLVLIVVWYACASALRGNGDHILLGWAGLFPLGYYYLALPREKPIINLDRVCIVVLIAILVLNSGDAILAPPKLKRAAVAWAAFLVVALLSAFYVSAPLSIARLTFDAFLLPGLLAWYMVRHFDARAHLKTVHVLVCLVSVFCASVGIAENVLQEDLMPFDNTDIWVAGVLRANGPFSTSHSMALIGLTSCILLLFIGKIAGPDFSRWQRILHRLGVAAAVIQAMLPFSRSVIFTLVVLALIDAWFTRGAGKRLLRLSVLGAAVALFLVVRMVAPEVYEDRSSIVNFNSRVAQQAQSLQVFLDNPVFGVGLGNFNEAVQSSKYLRTFAGAEAPDFPHSNLGSIASETGILGLVPFVAAQVWFLIALRDASSNSALGATAWKYLLYIFLVYWICGMAGNTGYYQDLNLWYLFSAMLIYKVVITARKQGMQSLATHIVAS